jgi:hypothetical protein
LSGEEVLDSSSASEEFSFVKENDISSAEEQEEVEVEGEVEESFNP